MNQLPASIVASHSQASTDSLNLKTPWFTVSLKKIIYITDQKCRFQEIWFLQN